MKNGMMIFPFVMTAVLCACNQNSDDYGNRHDCGNAVLDASEACDASADNAIGDKTCADFDSTKNWKKGKPGCDGCVLTKGTCVEEQAVATCGNGSIDEGEACDRTASNPTGKKTCSDFDPTGLWKSGGTPACDDFCKLTKGTCEPAKTHASCGNNVIDDTEACDPTASDPVGKKRCSDFKSNGKWLSGKPACDNECKLTQGSCKEDSCGDGIIDAEEKCEPTIPRKSCADHDPGLYKSGRIGCLVNCNYDLGACSSAPPDLYGLKYCQTTAAEYNAETRTLKVSGNLMLDPDGDLSKIDPNNIQTTFRCGTLRRFMHSWVVKSDAFMVPEKDPDNDGMLISTVESTIDDFVNGELICLYMVNTNQKDQSGKPKESWFACEKAPRKLARDLSSAMPADSYHTVNFVGKTIDKNKPEGAVVAEWNFESRSFTESGNENFNALPPDISFDPRARLKFFGNNKMKRQFKQGAVRNTFCALTEGWSKGTLHDEPYWEIETPLPENVSPEFWAYVNTSGNGTELYAAYSFNGNQWSDTKKFDLPADRTYLPVRFKIENPMSHKNLFVRIKLGTKADNTQTNVNLRIDDIGIYR